MAEVQHKTKKKKNPAAFVFRLIGSLILVAIILLCLPLTVPRIAGYEIYSVISGSMAPEIPVGSMVYVGYEAPEDVQEGDVIAFYSDTGSNAIITHRVVSNYVVAGEFETKGDANAEADINPIKYSNFIGVVKLSVPVVGGILATVTTTNGKITVGSLVLLAVVFHIIGGVFASKDEDKN